jgi:hypothetical protein
MICLAARKSISQRKPFFTAVIYFRGLSDWHPKH